MCVSLNIILFRYSTIFIINPFQISALSQWRCNPRIQKVGEKPATPFTDYCGGKYLPTCILLSRGGGGGGRKFSIRTPFMCKPYSIFQEEGGDAWEENLEIKQSTAEQIVSLTSIILKI